MPVNPIPGAPIEGSGLFFGVGPLLLAIGIIALFLWEIKHHPVYLLALLAIFAPLTEELVFEAGVTWSLPILLLIGVNTLFILNPSKLVIPRTLGIWIGIFIGVVLFSTAVQFLFGNPAVPVNGYLTVLRENVRFILLIVLFVYGISVLQTESVEGRLLQNIYKLVWICTVVASVISTLSLLWVGLTYAGVLPNELSTIFVQPGGVTLRLSGTNSEPSQFATYLVPNLFLAGGLALQKWPYDRRPVLLIAPIALATALSYSTSAMLMLFGASVVTIVLLIINRSIKQNVKLIDLATKITVFGIFAIGILLLGSSVSTLFLNRTSLSPISLLYVNSVGKLLTIPQSQRFDVYLTGLRLFSQHPIIGTGYGTHRFYVASPEFVGRARGPAATVIGVAVETGILGLVAFTGFLGALHRIIFTGVRKATNHGSFPMVLGGYLAFTSTVVGFALNANFHAVFVIIILILTTSIALSYDKNLKNELS